MVRRSIACFFTPKAIASVYKRINHPVTGVVPRPARIVQDVHKAVRAMAVIHEHKGAFVPGLAGGRVPGHRNTDAWIKTSNNHGGKRERLEYDLQLEEKGMHADLRSLLDDPERVMTDVFCVRDSLDDDTDEE